MCPTGKVPRLQVRAHVLGEDIDDVFYPQS